MENLNANQINEEKLKKRRKSKITNLVMFAINILIVFVILFYNINDNKDFTPLSSLTLNYKYLLIICAIVIVILIIDTFIVNRFIKKVTGKTNVILSYKSFAIMRYYDSITPMGAGGQPFMIAYLIKNFISGSKSTSIPVKKFLLQQFSWLIVTSFGLIYSIVTKSVTRPLVLIFAIIGFVINLFLDTFIMFGSSSESITQNISKAILKVLHKIKIVRNYDSALEKTSKFMKDYQTIMKEFSENKKEFFILLFLSIIKNIIYFAIPYFIYCVFAQSDMSLFLVFYSFAVMVELASSAFPLPGGSGMNEVTFSVLFATYLPSAVFWAMLLWRIVSYYILIIQGLLVMIIDLVKYPKNTFKNNEMHNILNDKNE